MAPDPDLTRIRPVRSAVLLAAGEGMRIRPVSGDTPKAILPVANRALILHHLDTLAAAGIEDITIVVGASAADIRAVMDADPTARSLSIRYIDQPQRRGIAHALSLVEPHISGGFILILADIFLVNHRLDLALAEFRDHRCACIIGAIAEPDPAKIARNFSITTDADGAATRVIEKPTDPSPGLKGVGAYIFTPAIFDAIRATPPSALRGEQELTDAIQTLIDGASPVRAVCITDADVNVNDARGLLDANLAALRHRGQSLLVADGARIDPTATLIDTVVSRGATIGPGASLHSCIVLPHATIERQATHHRCIITPDAIVPADASETT